MGKNDKRNAVIAILAILVAFMLFTPNGAQQAKSAIGQGGGAGSTNPAGGSNVQCNLGRATTVGVSAFSVLNGSAQTVNGYLLKPDGTEQVGQTTVNMALTSLTTSADSTFSGNLLLGNDNAVGTDLGDEVYFHMTPVSWTCQGNPTFPSVPVYTEGTLTLTVYDDGTAESTPNVTVNTADVVSTEIKMTVSSKGAFGNPDFANPVAVCFNASSPGKWNEIRPLTYNSVLPTPGFLSGNLVKGCYVLNTPALQDSATGPSQYRFGIKLSPAASQNVTNERITAIFLDKTYYKDDSGHWVSGFAKESTLAANADIGSVYTSDQAGIIIYNGG